MVSKGAFQIYTTGQLERATGITERTISYYNSLGLLSLEKKHGKKMVTNDDLILLVKIFIMKITGKKLKNIRTIVLEQKHPICELVRDLEKKNDQIIDLLIRLKQFDKKQNQNKDILPLLLHMNSFLQSYVE
ncbi:MerR family transcriptional regulator [Paenibacillus harenae]|uniref:MerR family transcriptional regulator n=1 Tax=Paenibacillus harenae TaxID=306543 RepID=UPI00146C32A5|nr:MerR family transcriptional regulator [Paenibacillus harenae]